jgi:hypothetical protein
MSMSTEVQATPTASGVTSPVGGLADKLVARLRTTPGQLELALLGLLAGAALFWIVAASVFSDLHLAVQTVGRDTVPSIVAAEKMNVALADINTTFANAILAKDDDSKPSWRTIVEDSDAVAQALITASENVTYGKEEEEPISVIQSNLPSYFRQLGQARSKLSGDPLPDLRAASELMQKTIIAAGFALDAANFRHLTAIYDRHRASQGSELSLLILALAALGALLVAIQFGLARRMRRLINLPLLGASLLLTMVGAYFIYVLVDTNALLRAAKQDSFDSIHALWQARAVAYDANAEESLYLLESGPLQNRHEQAFIDQSARLLSGPSPRDAVAKAVNGQFAEVKGFIGTELNNITYPGEREAATEMLRTFVDYLDVDRKIRDFEHSGRHAEAFALCIGTAPGQSDWAFERFDKALLKVTDINQQYFDSQIKRAFANLAWVQWISALIAVAIAVLAFLGLLPRIHEYRI